MDTKILLATAMLLIAASGANAQQANLDNQRYTFLRNLVSADVSNNTSDNGPLPSWLELRKGIHAFTGGPGGGISSTYAYVPPPPRAPLNLLDAPPDAIDKALDEAADEVVERMQRQLFNDPINNPILKLLPPREQFQIPPLFDLFNDLPTPTNEQLSTPPDWDDGTDGAADVPQPGRRIGLKRNE